MLGAAPGYNTVSRIPIHKKTRIVQRHTPVRLSKKRHPGWKCEIMSKTFFVSKVQTHIFSWSCSWGTCWVRSTITEDYWGFLTFTEQNHSLTTLFTTPKEETGPGEVRICSIESFALLTSGAFLIFMSAAGFKDFCWLFSKEKVLIPHSFSHTSRILPTTLFLDLLSKSDRDDNARWKTSKRLLCTEKRFGASCSWNKRPGRYFVTGDCFIEAYQKYCSAVSTFQNCKKLFYQSCTTTSSFFVSRKVALLYGKRSILLEGRNEQKLLHLLNHNFDEVHATMSSRFNSEVKRNREVFFKR